MTVCFSAISPRNIFFLIFLVFFSPFWLVFSDFGLGTVVVVAAAAQPSSAVCTDAPVARTQKKIKRKKKKSPEMDVLSPVPRRLIYANRAIRGGTVRVRLFKKKNDSGVSFNATKQVTSDDLTNVPADVGRSMST